MSRPHSLHTHSTVGRVVGQGRRQEGVREEGRKEREKVEGRRSGESETQTQCTPYAGQRG